MSIASLQSSDEIEVLVGQILDATTIKGKPGVYFLGPYAKRLNFRSQQNRALNLVGALKHKGRIAPGQRVAVVGGGLAGLTATVALLGSCPVTLYERKGSVLLRQRNTVHRYVHPTVNFWPEEALNPTTNFPFFDWYAGRCDEVIRQLEQEWDRTYRGKVFCHFGSRVRSLTLVDGKVRVECEGSNAGDFSLVLVAAGFDEEVSIRGTASASYWQPDGLDHMRDNDEGPFTVSGAGDGGIIDALRLVHGDFEGGRLIVEVASLMEQLGLLAEAPLNEAGYHEVVSTLPPDIERIMSKSLEKSRQPVTLIGGGPTAFSQQPAPIHLIFLAHAISRSRIVYQQGKVIQNGPDLILKEKSGDRKLDPIKTVIRHGPGGVLADLLTEQEVSTLKDKQMHLSDYHINPVWKRLALPVNSGCPPFNVTDALFVKSRFARARKLENDYPQIRLSAKRDRFCYYVDGTEPLSLPPKLFGIVLERGQPNTGQDL